MPVLRVLRLPLLVPYWVAADRSVIDADVARWDEELGTTAGKRGLLAHLRLPYFRNLYYHRLWRAGRMARHAARLAAAVYRPEATLHLETAEIGPAFYLQHGFATIVAAERIGRGCMVNQQVTIGWTDAGAPVVGDGVAVRSGAQVIGPVTLGDGCTVGAGAVVVRDVEPGATAVGVPAHRRYLSCPGTLVAF